MIPRKESKYENHSSKFIIETYDYDKQFCYFYRQRIAEMTELIKPLTEKKWGKDYAVKKIFELRSTNTDSCIVIGTIFKHQTHKPSILRVISEENQLAPQPQRQNYADIEDKLILEDELQRVQLYGKVNINTLATGAVCAVLGTVEEDGRFDVEDMLFYESGPQRPLQHENGTESWLVIISGLDQINSHNFAESLNLFQHWLAGNIPNSYDKDLVRLIVAGNSVRSVAEKMLHPLKMIKSDYGARTLKATTNLDEMFASWSTTLPVDVMPGANDPANFMLPQQPFPPFMFPKAARYTSFQSVPNPYICTVEDTLIIGCSGQNVSDILRSSNFETPLDALKSTIICGHMAPTAPDTLASYPFITSDPYIMRECPHIYFTGNCDDFATELHVGSAGQRTRLICVPSFSKTQSVAIVNLSNLDCKKINFFVESE